MPATSSSEPALRILRPKVGASRTEAAEASADPTANGAPVRPACSALNPRPIWSHSEKVRKNAGTPMKKMPATASPATNGRWRNRSRSTRGDPSRAFFRRSWTAKPASTGRAAAIDTNVHRGQPRSRPWTSG